MGNTKIIVLFQFLLIMVISFNSAGGSRCECSSKIIMLLRYDDYRVLLSPEYPRPYCGELSCIWRVVAPDNSSRIHFFAKNIDLRRERDSISFYDSHKGVDLDPELVHPSYTCTGTGDCYYKGSGQFLTIQFKTDSGVPDHYGFQGTISLYDRQYKAWLSSIWNVLLVALISVGCTLGLTVLAYFLICKRFLNTEKTPLSKDEEETIASTSHSKLPTNSDISQNQRLLSIN
jgi:ABC-type maltose transport system permease subunit